MKSSIRSRSEHRWCAVALGVLLSLASLPAVATEVSDEAKAQAREKFTQGNEAYARGEFRQALTAFDAAYKLAPLPGFLFNVAQCHRQLGDYELAAFFYRSFLSLSEKEPANAGMVKELIAEMDTRVRQESAKRAEKEKAVAQAKASDRPRAEPARKPEARAEAKPERRNKLKEAERQAVESRTVSAKPKGLAPEAVPGAPVPEVRESLSRKWWVWAGAGAAVVLAGGIVYAATSSGERPTTLGTIHGR
jgi:tetratricopeptide (TPR) repeat protein